MRSAGKTLQEIGDEWGVTRERARQLLAATGMKFERVIRRVPKVQRESKNCERCNNIFDFLPSQAIGRKRRFCSVVCWKSHVKDNAKWGRTGPKADAHHRQLARDWYAKRRLDPKLKLLIKLRNNGIRGVSIRDDLSTLEGLTYNLKGIQ